MKRRSLHFIYASSLIVIISISIHLSIANYDSSYGSYGSSQYYPHRHRKVLAFRDYGDKINQVRVLLEWEIDFEREKITFDLTAWTTGYVGFGLKIPSSSLKANNNGRSAAGMADSDIVIGGIYPNGSSYFADYHGMGNFAPVRDSSQDWDLHAAFENATHTFLRFSRQFDTCDSSDDVKIVKNQSLHLLWALAKTDKFIYHGVEERAIFNETLILLADEPEILQTIPPPPQQSVADEMILKGYPSWTTMINVEMKEASAYRCTFHRGPRFYSGAHAVAFIPVINDPRADHHVHHFTFYQCKVPRDMDAWETFEPLVEETGGNDCYSSDGKVPVQFCMQVLYVWCPGEKGMSFPDEVGYLLNDPQNPQISKYFMLEVHYENYGKSFTDTWFSLGIRVFYSPWLRPYDAGFLGVAHAVSDSLFIPPQSKSFKIEGRCSSECTAKSFPNEGVTVISVMLHAHQYARKIKLRHFRNNMELPWLAVENEFKFNSQKMKRITDERKILQGDSLVIECEYDTSSRNSVTTGGFASTSEMCTAFLWYYPQIDLDDCSSEYPIKNLHLYFGYPQNPNGQNIWDMRDFSNFPSFINQNIKWTTGLRNEVQEMLISSNHHASCLISNDISEEQHDMIAEPVTIRLEMTYKPGQIVRHITGKAIEEFRCKNKKKKKNEVKGDKLREWWKKY